MVGNRVRVVLIDCNTVTGTLHRLETAGVIIWRDSSLPEGQGNSFIPMHRIREIVDLGRAP